MSSGSVDIATLGIEIRSDGVLVASDRLRQLQNEGGRAEGATKKLSSSFSELSGAVKVATGAIAGLAISKYISDATLLSARVETLGVVMKVVGNNAGYTGAQMESYAQSVAKMGITTKESRDTVIKMAQANLDLTKSTQLARVAQDAAVIGGINSSEALQRLMHGIVTLQPEILRGVGIVVNFEGEMKRAATATGKHADQLSGAERQQVALNAVLREGAKIAGAYEAAMGTAGKQLSSLPRYFEELKLQLGDTFRPVFTEMVKDLTEALTDLNKEMSSSKNARGGLGEAFQDAYNFLKAGGYQALSLSASFGEAFTYGTTRQHYRSLSDQYGKTSSELLLGMNLATENDPATIAKREQAAQKAKEIEEQKVKAAKEAKKAEEDRLKAEAAATEAAKKSRQEAEQFTKTLERLREERALNTPLLSEEEKAQARLRNEYDRLIAQFPKRKQMLEQQYQLSKKQLDATQDIARVEKELAMGEDERLAAGGAFGFSSKVSQVLGDFKAPGQKKPTTFQYGGAAKGYSLLNPGKTYEGGGGGAFDAAGYHDYISKFGSEEDKQFQGTVDQVDELGKYLDRQLITHEEYTKKLEDIYKKNDEKMSEIEQTRAENAILTASNTIEGVSALLMQGSKDQFEVGKGLAIVTAIIETYLSAQKAYTALVGLGPAGPALAAAAAGVAIAMGMARVQMIKNQEYNPSGRALGGRVNAGQEVEVGEWGRERFVPDVPGTIIPNHELKNGGTTVAPTIVFNISTGVQDTVRAELNQMMPTIEKRTVGAVHSAIESGGPLAKAVGRA